MESTYKFRETFDVCYYLLLQFIKKLKKWLGSRRTIGNGMKILKNFGENRL